MDSHSLKKYAVLSILGGVVLGFFLFNVFPVPKASSQSKTTLASVMSKQTKTVDSSVSIVFVGDIMLGRGVKTSVYKNFAGDYDSLFANVPEIKSADIAFANLEGPVTDAGPNVGSKYSFMFEPKVTDTLSRAGFDIVSVANNHAGDRSVIGFTNTILNLKNNNIVYAGGGTNYAEASTVKIIEKNGIKIGFLAFSDVGPNWIKATDTNPGILLASDPNFEQIISDASKQIDTLVVSFHFGEEYKYNTHTARQAALAHKAIDAGAKIVVGAHPHVAEDIESYNGGLIMYSLGNFIFDQSFSQHTMRGMVGFVTVHKDGTIERNFKTVVLNSKLQPDHLEDSPIKEGQVMPAFATGYANEESVVNEVEKKLPIKEQCEVGNPLGGDPMFLNVGQEVAIPVPSYVPPDLIPLDKSISEGNFVCLRKEVASTIARMLADAKANGLTLTVSSGFRSYKTQQAILTHWIGIRGSEAYKRVAKPGYSEHQLGTTVDFSGSTINFDSATEAFGTSPEALWLETHAASYGFVRSYPEGKEAITGYAYEPWHYRYVGIDYAQKIKSSGLTINEFLKNILASAI
jgi:poly-gamma-glutamate synthesis protein (capsule biosynthesis protein)